MLHTVLGNDEIRLKWAEFKLLECSIIFILNKVVFWVQRAMVTDHVLEFV